MKPHVICHMAISLDGAIAPERWRPRAHAHAALYETLHAWLGGQAWLIGRVTAQAYARPRPYRAVRGKAPPRQNWIVAPAGRAYAVILDEHGTLAWGRAEIGGDPIVVILTQAAPDACVAGLRRDGVSYIFAGETKIDLNLALKTLRRELKVERLLLEGGGVINGAFLRAGLIDEVSLLVMPVIDGAAGAPGLFGGESDSGAIKDMTLKDCTELEAGAVWLRYGLEA